MDIRSLRIGDIVTTDGTPANTKKGEYYEVINIISDEWWNDEKENIKHIGWVSIKPITDRNEYVGGAWVDYLQPVPITDELLKSLNAEFILRNNGGRVYMIGFCSIQKIINADYYTFTAEAGRWKIRTSKHIKYLHELQHEIFDAGVELKIKL